MPDPTPSRPLWQVMQMAYPPPDKIREPSVDNLYRQIAAAELRAIADEVVPLEPKPNRDHFSADFMWAYEYERWNQRMKIRKRLTAEADRAEAGG